MHIYIYMYIWFHTRELSSQLVQELANVDASTVVITRSHLKASETRAVGGFWTHVSTDFRKIYTDFEPTGDLQYTYIHMYPY